MLRTVGVWGSRVECGALIWSVALLVISVPCETLEGRMCTLAQDAGSHASRHLEDGRRRPDPGLEPSRHSLGY